MSIKHTQNTLIFILTILTISLSGTAWAQEEWTAYKNPDKLYEVRVPVNFKITESSILIGNNAKATGDIITATVPSNDEDSLDKLYRVKFSQTLGAALNKEEIQKTLSADVTEYLNSLVKYNGALVERKIFSDSTGLRVADLYITFDDPKRGPSHLRTRIYRSSVSRAQQTVIGSETAMFSYRSKDFFNSMSIHDGYAHHKGTFFNTWKPYTSPTNMFTVLLPDEDGLYVTRKPVIQRGKRSEVVGIKFFDPFLEKTLTYSVYAHKFNVNLNQTYAMKALQKLHLEKNQITWRNTLSNKREDGMIEALFFTTPTPKNGFATFGKLFVEYSGKNMIVHELYGSETLVISNFIGNVIDNVDFHPEKETTPESDAVNE